MNQIHQITKDQASDHEPARQLLGVAARIRRDLGNADRVLSPPAACELPTDKHRPDEYRQLAVSGS